MKIRSLVASMAALLLTLSSGPLSGQAPARVQVAPESLSLKVGEAAKITATVFDENGNEIDVPVMFFATADEGGRAARSRLDVNRRSGDVRAVKGGEYRVLAVVTTASQVRNAVPVSVEYPSLARIDVEPDAGGTLYVGTAVRHRGVVIDEAEDERDLPLHWSSTSERIASVDRHGVVTAHMPGTVELMVAAAGRDGSTVQAHINYTVADNPVTEIELSASQESGRTGDVIRFEAQALTMDAEPVPDIPIRFAMVSDPDPTFAQGDFPPAEIDETGAFVAYKPGLYTVTASVPGTSARATVEITPRHVSEVVELVGQAAVRNVRTSDLWVWAGQDGRDYAITGTWGAFGAVYFWDVTDPASPVMTDSVVVDARTTNDVKVSEDGNVCVFSREGASNRRNGIVIVDCSDPRNVEILSTFDDELTGGVHNVFVYDNHVYAVNNGVRFDVINIEDPTTPHRVGRFELDTPGHAIHDIWIVDGIAYTSNWGDGVVVIDVGGGDRGGSPANPVEIARFADVGGATHAAFPYQSPTGKFYIFMGDEIGRAGFDGLDGERVPPSMAGYIHVVDFTDPENPEEVARYEVPEAGSHNYWIEDDRLYAAFYNGGLRVVDISGELKGNLYHQGREIARYLAYDPDGYVANAPFTWGPQMFKGNLFFAEHHSGLWAVKLQPRTNLIP